MAQVLLGQMVGSERAAAGAVDAGVCGDAVQVLIRQQPLGQAAEGDAAGAGVGQGVEQLVLNPAVEQAVGRLVDQRFDAHAFQNRGGFAGLAR